MSCADVVSLALWVLAATDATDGALCGVGSLPSMASEPEIEALMSMGSFEEEDGFR